MQYSLPSLFQNDRRRGVRCTARRLDISGRKVDGGLEAKRAMLPRARRKTRKGWRGWENLVRAIARCSEALEPRKLAMCRVCVVRLCEKERVLEFGHVETLKRSDEKVRHA